MYHFFLEKSHQYWYNTGQWWLKNQSLMLHHYNLTQSQWSRPIEISSQFFDSNPISFKDDWHTDQYFNTTLITTTKFKKILGFILCTYKNLGYCQIGIKETLTGRQQYQYQYLVLQLKVLVNDTCSKAHPCHQTTLMDGWYLVFSTIQIPILVLLVTCQPYRYQYHYLDLSDTDTYIIIQTSAIYMPIPGISG